MSFVLLYMCPPNGATVITKKLEKDVLRMEKVIRVNGIEIFKNSCQIKFVVYCELDEMKPLRITHNKLYELLDTATIVKAYGEHGIEFMQGIVTFKAYKIKE